MQFESARTKIFFTGKKTGEQEREHQKDAGRRKQPSEDAGIIPKAPILFRQLLVLVCIEHPSERRAKDALGIKYGHAKGISVTDLMGVIIDTNFPADKLDTDEPGDKGTLDHIKMLCQAAEGDVHILIGLGKHVHGNTAMPVILEPLDSIHGERLVLAGIKIYTSLINDKLAVIDRHFAYVRLAIHPIGALDGHVGKDTDRTFPMLTIYDPIRKTAGEPAAQTDHDALTLRPPGQVGSEGGLAGAGHTEIDIELEGMLGIASRRDLTPEDHDKEQQQISHNLLL